MSTFLLNIATPEKMVYDGEAQEIIVRTTEGDVAILKNHINFVSILDIGELKIKTADGKEKKAAVGDGFISVTKEKTTLIVVKFEWAEDIDLSWAQRNVAEIKEKLASQSTTDNMKKALNLKLRRAENRIKIIFK